MKCIYCKEEKHNSKGVEHVIPQSFGRFSTKTPVLDCVCDECNAFFAKELDLKLARETLEGITRYKRGIFSRETRPQKSLHITLGENAGEFEGVILEDIDGKTGRLGKPLPQAHLINEDTGKYEAVLKKDIPTLDVKQRHFSTKDMRIFAPSQKEHDAVIAELAKVNIPFKKKAEFKPKFLEGKKDGDTVNIEVNIHGTIDHQTKRALSKVLFNFAAHDLGAIEVLKKEWDKARNYIRLNGDPLGVRITNKPFWGTESQNLRYESDSCNIRIDNQKSDVIGTIQFYNLYTYDVRLIENYSVPNEFAARFTPGQKPEFGFKFFKV
jgi:hypothetical protein